MNGRAWTRLEDLELAELFPHFKTATLAALFGRSISALYGHAAKLGLRKSAEYLASADACRLRRSDNPGIAHRFKPGHVPANKGLRRPGWARGRMRETQFKKGERNWHQMPIGATHVADGYVLVKVAEVPRQPYTVNWKALHVIEWERTNGRPVPVGHCLRFRDGNHLNVDVANLELITRRENGRRNSMHRLPMPVRRAIHAKAALNRRINDMEKRRAEDA